VGKKIFPFGVKDFYWLFLSEDAIYPFEAFYESQNFKDINKSQTLIVDGNPKLTTFTLTCTMKITGIPFISAAKLVKTVSIDRSDPLKLTVEMIHQTPDLPYADHFVNQEKWVVYSTCQNGNKCLVRSFNRTQIIKSTVWEGLLRARCKEDMLIY